MLQSECSNRILLLEGTAKKNSVTIKEMPRAEENHMIRTNEIVTLYHGSKSGIRGILDEQKLTEDDRKKLKQESEDQLLVNKEENVNHVKWQIS